MSDVFISYAREDQEFVRWLHGALVDRGREVWVDWEGVAPSAGWREEILRAIEAADAFVFVVTPDSLRSRVCAEELAHAGAHNKRVVPVVLREPGDVAVPELVAEHNWIFCRDPAERDAALALVIEALDTDLDWVHAHTRLLVRARDWDRGGASRALLLRGSDLSGAEADLDAHARDDPAPTELQRRYVLASRRGATRRLRIAMSVSLVALVAIGALAVVAVIQAQDARETAAQDLSRRLAADANAQLDADPQLSLILALEAYDTRPTVDAQSAVRQATLENRERAVFAGHTDEVDDVAVSPDGSRLATASRDGTARVWQLADARAAPRILQEHQGPVRAVAFSPDGSYLATASDTGARVWDLHDAASRPIMVQPSERVVDVAFSPDGRHLATATSHVARVQDWRTGDVVAELPHDASVNAIAFSPDGRFVATAIGDDTTADDAALVWDWAQSSVQPIAVLRGHVAPVHGVAFSPDGTRLATASYDQTARVWDWPAAREVAQLTGHDAALQSVAFSPDGTRLVTSSIDQTARVWRWQQPGRPPTVLRGQTGTMSSALFIPSGTQVVTASSDSTVALWDVARPDVDPVELAGVDREIHDPLDLVDDFVRAIAVSPDGTLVATGGEHETRVWRWQQPDAAPMVLRAADTRVLDVAFSPDGRYLATATSDAVARIWDLKQPTAPPAELRTHQREVHGVAFSPDGSFLVTTSYDGSAKVWRWPDPGDVEVGTYSHGNSVAIDGAVNRDAVHVATSTFDGTARVWDARNTGDPGVVLRQPGQVISVAFDPGGTFLATAGEDHIARVWDWRRRGATPIELRGHDGTVVGVAFSPDGSRVATASTDRTVRVWDWRAPDERPLVLQHASGVLSLAFAPDGHHLVTGSNDTIARVWDCQECAPIRQVVRLARSRVARPLSARERAHYLG